MSSSLNLTDITSEIQERLPSMDCTVGKGYLQPNNCTNSGSRKNMQGIQKEQGMQLEHGEAAILMTGGENQFGEASSSFIRADANYRVIDKISKHSGSESAAIRESNYWLILIDEATGTLHTTERIDYKHIVESYGYRYDNTYMDNLKIGDIIPNGTPIKKSSSFDSVNNKCDGVNITTVYMASAATTDDPIVISDVAAVKFAAPLISPVQVQVNDNDILLNLYGDDDNYKTFPDIGENVKDGILCGVRKERKDDEALFSQAWERLKGIMISDETYIAKGKVIDINVYCNNPEKLQSSIYNKQIANYYFMHRQFCLNVLSCIDPLLETGLKMSYDMEKLYYRCKAVVDGKQYIYDKVFNNIILELVVMEIIPLNAGDKITNRYGGKGVISKVLPVAEMPHYKYLGQWEPVEAIYNSNTVVNRENPGQELEVSTIFVGLKLIEDIILNKRSLEEAEDMLFRYKSIISKTEASAYKWTINNMEVADRRSFMDSILSNGYIYIVAKPITESMTLDKLRALYAEFPWIELSEVMVPLKDSNGKWRYIKARRRLVTGKQYIYRLKQFAEEKFSAVSLASTNIRSENTKSKMNKLYKAVHASTPVRIGDMEAENLMHMEVECVIQALMLLSTSPLARRQHEELLTGNPFDINIKLDKDSKSRSVEIVNAYLKTAGLRLVFDKIPKNKGNTALRIIATRIPGAIALTDVVERVPKFIECMDTLKELANKRAEVLDRPLNIAYRVPSHIKTQEEAQLYIQDQEMSKNISDVLSLVNDDVKTMEQLEERVNNPEVPIKLTEIVSRVIAERIPDNFAK